MIPNSYDYEYLKEKSKEKVTDYDFEEDTPVILSVSRLAKVKNIDLLINAHAILKKNGIKQRLLIVGDGEYRKNLEDLCKRLNVENSVTFLGKKNNPYPYFIKSDIFVSASYIEGFSLTGIEAMALKVALIATDLPNACATLIKIMKQVLLLQIIH